uniref:Uncharacterized protein n=1 Tax=Spermophilus dauricus TaxID=99837 RepID=A0A8C9PYY2_SPEDA
MLSRLQELRKEEETLLRLKAALHDQLKRLKELALQSIISSRKGDEMLSSQPGIPEQSHDVSKIKYMHPHLECRVHYAPLLLGWPKIIKHVVKPKGL